MVNFPKIAQLRQVDDLRAHLEQLGLELPADDRVLSAAEGSPLAESFPFGRYECGNRWCIHPMEGWDAEPDGRPSALTLMRWRNFGRSGAKLIWGGEAAAVRVDGRANPRQTLALPRNRDGLQQLYFELLQAHDATWGNEQGLVVGLQLTHSGRFSVDAAGSRRPRIAYHHPLLDARFGIDPQDDALVWTDAQIETLIDDYVAAAETAASIGYQFVDVKASHGYLLHEFLSARVRPGRFGGDFQGRTRLLTTIIARIREACPGLDVGVRLSVFDVPPYDHSGQPMRYTELLPYSFGFGMSAENPLEMDLREPIQLIQDLHRLGVVAVNVSAGSPYYAPHIQRPAAFPPSDGYAPPEDPLLGVVRQIQATRICKQGVPGMTIVGTGYSYLQEYLPHVAQAVVRQGWADAVGLGRMVLSYPTLPWDTLTGAPWQRKRVCRTFSDCTTAPRNGLVSGCYPLDPAYKSLPEAAELRRIKEACKTS